MKIPSFAFVSSCVAVALAAVMVFPPDLAAQSASVPQQTQHLVTPSDLQNAVMDASQVRQQNLTTVSNFLSTDQASQAMTSAGMNPEQVKSAAATLSNDELAQLAVRAQKAQTDFAAGTIGNHDLLIILLCIAALILIIVAVR